MGAGGAEGLEAWDAQFAEYTAAVILRRAKFVEYLARAAAGVYSQLTDGGRADRDKLQTQPGCRGIGDGAGSSGRVRGGASQQEAGGFRQGHIHSRPSQG